MPPVAAFDCRLDSDARSSHPSLLACPHASSDADRCQRALRPGDFAEDQPCGTFQRGGAVFIFRRILLPASLGSTGITPLHRYYGRSDSWPAVLRRLVEGTYERRRFRPGLSVSRTRTSDHSASNHLVHPDTALSRYPSACRASLDGRKCVPKGLSFALRSQARRSTRPNRVHCGGHKAHLR